MGSDYLTIDNLRKMISEDIQKESAAESKGDFHGAAARCEAIIGSLKLLAKVDSDDQGRYNEVVTEWEKKKRSLKSSDGTTKAPAKAKKKDEGLIGKMDSEFRSRIEALISDANIKWSEIGGLEEEKTLIREAVFFANATPNIDVHLPKLRNLLLFGPPGTGKTTIAKAICSNIGATFFNVTLSELLSRYVGDSERLVSMLYETAREKAPSIVFVDEVESLVGKRDNSNRSSGSVLQQFLGQLDGFGTGDAFVMTVAATNVPWELDTAILSRFEKKIYIGLPDKETRKKIIEINTTGKGIKMAVDINDLTARTENFSGRDVYFLCAEAIRNMLRRTNQDLIRKMDDENSYHKLGMKYLVGEIGEEDFASALEKVKPVSDRSSLNRYMDWKDKYANN